MPLRIETTTEGVKLNIKVVPGASRDRIAGELGDALKVAVSKPPQGGQANEAVIELLADALGVPRRDIQITAGQHRPRKQVLVRGVSADAVQKLLS